MSITYSHTSHNASLSTLESILSGESDYLSHLSESIKSLVTKLSIFELAPTRIQRREQLFKEMVEFKTHSRSQGIVTCL